MVLNRQLMRMVLRPFGSPEFLDAEGELWLALWPTCLKIARRQEEDAEELRGELHLLWRSGRLTGLSKQHFVWKMTDIRRRRRPMASLDSQPAREDGAVRPETGAMARDIVAAVRGSLSREDQELLDAWLASGGANGWQRQYARASGLREPMVSKRVEKIRGGFRDRHGVLHPDDFIQLVSGHRVGELAAVPPQDEAVPHPSSPNNEADGPADLTERVARVRGSFEPSDREYLLASAMWDGAPVAEITAAFPDEPELLTRLHVRYYTIAKREREEGDAVERKGET